MTRRIPSIKTRLGAFAAVTAAVVLISAPTALAAPTARFTFSPTAPLVNRAVSFNGSTSTCDVPPCRYQWVWYETTGKIGGRMGEGKIISYTFTWSGTKRVVLKVTNSTSTHGSSTLTKALVVK